MVNVTAGVRVLARDRNVALLIPSNALSSAGNSVYIVATGWLAYQLSGSATAVGVALSLRLLPTLLFGPLTGVVIDRVDRKRLLVATSLFLTAVAAALVTLLVVAQAHLVILFAYQFLIGTGQVVRGPVRRAIYADALAPTLLLNALALDRTAFEGVRLVSPLLVSAILAWFGAPWAFLAQVACYLAASVLLMGLRLPPRVVAPRRGSAFWQDALLGIDYVRCEPRLALLMVLLLAERVAGPDLAAYILPVFAAESLGTGPEGVGWLLAAFAAGGLLGTGGLALTPSSMDRWKLLGALLGLMAAALVAFGLCAVLPAAMAAYLVVALAHANFLVSVDALVHVHTESGYRGRVDTLVSTVEGLAAGGGLLGGVLADVFGPATAIVLSGLAMGGTAVVATLCGGLAARSPNASHVDA